MGKTREDFEALSRAVGNSGKLPQRLDSARNARLVESHILQMEEYLRALLNESNNLVIDFLQEDDDEQSKLLSMVEPTRLNVSA